MSDRSQRQDVIDRIIRNEADMAYRRRVQTILDWIDPQDDDLILDAGTGRGFYPRFVRQVSGARVVGLELEFEHVEIAMRTLAQEPNVLLANANLYHIPLPDTSVDHVILSEVLEHVDDDVAVLSSLRRVLKPGGTIAITVPNANYPFWWDPVNKTLEATTGKHIGRGPLAGIWANHVRLYTRDDLHQAVTDAGLEVADERSFTHHSFPFIHNIVYGLGKPIFEAGLLPSSVASAADRHNVSGERGSLLNPVNLGLTVFEWFDRKNIMNEPPERSTVNLCILARRTD